MNRYTEHLHQINPSRSQKMLPSTVFWRIAEDIPQNLTWTLMFLSIAVPLVFWWIIVIFPFILPTIIDACRVNMAGSWNLVIVSELVSATEGLGRRISVAQRFLKTISHTDFIEASARLVDCPSLM